MLRHAPDYGLRFFPARPRSATISAPSQGINEISEAQATRKSTHGVGRVADLHVGRIEIVIPF